MDLIDTASLILVVAHKYCSITGLWDILQVIVHFLRYQDGRRICVYGGGRLLHKNRGGVNILIMKLVVCYQRSTLASYYDTNNYQLSINTTRCTRLVSFRTSMCSINTT